MEIGRLVALFAVHSNVDFNFFLIFEILSGESSTEYMKNSKVWPPISNIEICFTSEEWGITGILEDLFQSESISYGIKTGRTIIYLG
jgi:hypothetical protein